MGLPLNERVRSWPIGTKLLALTIPLLILVTLAAAWIVHQRNTASLTEKLTQRARSLHTQIMADREYYASVIVPRVVDLGGSLGSDYRKVHGQFPLPATFVREVSELTAKIREGYSANLISPWPINKEKGIKDTFQRKAFSYLSTTPSGQFFRTDTVEGKAVMRVLMADRASAQSCVDCHNAHPQSPKHDFKFNDLMGGLEILMPMDQYLQESRRELVFTLAGGGGLCVLLVGILVAGTRQIVTQPMAKLAKQMQAFAQTQGDVDPFPAASPAGDEIRYLAAAHEHMQAVIEKQQRQLREANTRLGDQVLELQAVNDELAAFSYSVSHDLRGPLRAMDGFSRILLEDYAPSMPEEAREYLRLVRANAQQMDQLVHDLLEFSRLGRRPLTRQTVGPAQLVRQVLEELREERDGRSVEISVGELSSCKADPILLKQVFVNLLSNALKFTRLREHAKITIGCRAEGEQHIYFVKDNGVGFDMEYASQLFGVFQRLHRSEDFEGSGVGLAIVQRIIHRHGGRVWVEAAVDKGATFYFSLPKETPP